MFKKSINLFMLIVVVMLSSCVENGKQVESTEAATVNIVKTNNTITYNKIKTGSFLDWKASHLGGIDQRLGKIYYKNASILVNNGKVSNANFVIDMSKMTVDNLPDDDAKELVKHLKSSDFFDIEKYPNSKFELTKIEATQGEYNSKVIGNLSILGLAKSIAFNANINVSENAVSIKSENFSINRADWGLTYNSEGTKGVPLDYLISNEIGFKVNITLAK